MNRRRHALGCQRDQHDAGALLDQGRGILLGRLTEQCSIVHARLLGGKERPLQVDAEHAGIGRSRLAHRAQRRPHLRRRIGDQRRQQRRGAEPQMGGGDPVDGLGRRRVVEQHIPAAVDLAVDEPRRQPRALPQGMERNAGRHLVPGQDRCDARTVDNDRAVVLQTEPVEHRARNDGVPLRHGAALLGEWRIANGKWGRVDRASTIRHSPLAIRQVIILSG